MHVHVHIVCRMAPFSLLYLYLPLILLPSLSLFTTEQPIAYDIAKHMRTWSSIAFYLAVAINLMVAFFYPFDKGSEYVGKFTPRGSYTILSFWGESFKV